MSNSYFQFKQFTIQQDQCAMKVCTDACLFGAWVAMHIENEERIKSIADIGSGTGLLGLMLAQKNNAAIDAVELNADVANQAKQNFEASPWKDRLTVFNDDILSFIPQKKYDFIISNPPFFEEDLKSSNSQRNTAMHSTTLTLQQLLQQIKRLIQAEGSAAVLIPYKRCVYFEELLEAEGFFIKHAMLVKQSAKHDFFRSQYIFSLKQNKKNISRITIQDAERKYSDEFTALLKPYYYKL